MKNTAKFFGTLLPSSSANLNRILVTGLTSDSQAVEPGYAFFAIKGSRYDGHQFIDDAVRRGASVLVVENSNIQNLKNCLYVPNSRAALALASHYWYGEPTRDLSLVGVTGTNGKTTTTYLLRDVWNEEGIISGIIGTVQNQIGSEVIPAKLTTPGPLELQGLFHEMKVRGAKRAAMEVSSIALHQDRTWGCSFKVALFTNLTQDHLDYHGDFENYYLAKRKLFTDYNVPIAVINADDPWGKRLVGESTARRTVTFSVIDSGNSPSEYVMSELALTRFGARARLKTPKGRFEFRSRFLGRHNLYNALGVVAACDQLGISMPTILKALGESAGAPGRLERVELPEEFPTVFVDYAHSTDALENVLRALGALRGSFSGRIITVFGCGGDRDRKKRPEMGAVASMLSEVTILTSDNPRTENPESILDEIAVGISKSATEFHREVDRRRAISLALSLATRDDVVLIAGKGHENYQVLGTATIPFDDADEVRKFYAPVDSNRRKS